MFGLPCNISGEELGVLTTSGEQGRRPHSIKTREAALKRKNQNKVLIHLLLLFSINLKKNTKKKQAKEDVRELEQKLYVKKKVLQP